LSISDHFFLTFTLRFFCILIKKKLRIDKKYSYYRFDSDSSSSNSTLLHVVSKVSGVSTERGIITLTIYSDSFRYHARL